MRIDMEAADVKLAAAGRWREILPALAGIDGELLDGKHHPCPLCGGTDRFRAFNDVAQTGGVICNQCHNHKNGDGLATLQWACGWSFSESISQVANYLGMESSAVHRGALDRYCDAKSIPPKTMRLYGAIEHSDGTIELPMYGPDGRVCSTMTLGLGSERHRKGIYAKGKPTGLFWTAKPTGLVAIVEGVKDAAALTAIGVTAVGLPMSSLAPKFASLFAGCDVLVVPDRDKAGEAGAEKTASALEGHAKSVQVARLPGRLVETDGDGVREAIKSSGVDAVLASLKAPKPAPTQTSIRITTLADAERAYIEKLRDGDTGLISTGFAELDEAIGGGVERGEMVVIAARPSHGKSALALQWLMDAADGGMPGAMISQEMSALAIGKRCLQNQSQMTVGELRQSTKHAESIVAEQSRDQAPIHIVEGCGDVNEVCRQIDEMVDRNGVEVVAVDYLQLLRDKGASRYEQVTAVSQRLRHAATQNGIVLLALAQLSRAIEQRPDRTPMLSDLKESGQIEQDADVALMLAWPWRFDEKFDNPAEFRVVVAKNRNREIKKVHVALDWSPEHQRFADQEPKVFEEFSQFAG